MHPDLAAEPVSRPALGRLASCGSVLGSPGATCALSVGLVVAHLALQGRVAGPWLPDEVAYLGGAETLVGRSPALLDDVPYYRWGYSVVLVPVHILPLGDAARFQAVTVLNAVLLAAVYPLVRTLLVRVVGARPGPASLAALLGALQPVVWVYGGFALSEPLLLVLVPAWLLSVHSSAGAGRPSPWFVAATLALYATHDRLVVALVPATWLLVELAVRHPGARRRVVAAAGGLVAGVIAVFVVDRWMEAVRWASVAAPEAADGGIGAVVSDPSRWDDIAAGGVGHGWQLAVSGGVPLAAALLDAARRARDGGGGGGRAREALLPAESLGTATLVRPSDSPGWPERGSTAPPGVEPSSTREADPGPPGGPGAHPRAALDPGVPGRAVTRSAVLLFGGLVVASVLFLTVGGTRADHLVYGRYAEVALPPLLGLGVVALLRSRRTATVAAWVTVASTGALGLALATLPWTEAVRIGRVPVLHAPSLALLTNGSGPLAIGRATAVAVVFALVVAGAAHLRALPGATARRGAGVVLVVCVLSLVAFDGARSATVLADARRDHARAVARR